MEARTGTSKVQLNRKLVLTGAVLGGVGSILCATGFLLSSSAVLSAARKWYRQLERPPGKIAKQRFGQVKHVAAAGINAWQDGQ